jgi:RNA polymerase sigma factor (TIGR02999 family)
VERSDESGLTEILRRMAAGEANAETELLPRVYAQLQRIAQRRMAGERAGHSLQATELVHEAYVHLAGNQHIEWRDRAHFFGAAAEAMRRILVDHARKRARQKRGGAAERVPLNVVDLARDDDPDQILALDAALTRLDMLDRGLAEVVRLRFLAGLSVEETAQALAVSTATVKRDWAVARAWLYRAIGDC